MVNLTDEIDALIEKVKSGEVVSSPDVMEALNDISDELNLLENKKKKEKDQNLLKKIDELIKIVSGQSNELSDNSITKIIEAIQKVNVLVPEVKVNIPEVKIPEVKFEPPKVTVTVPEIKPANVTVTPAPVVFPEEFNLSKPNWIEKLFKFESLLKVLNEIKEKINFSFKWPNDAKEPIAVRLSDGNRFYQTSGGGGSSGANFPFANKSRETKAAIVDNDGYIQVDVRSMPNVDYEEDKWGKNAIDDTTTTSVVYYCYERADGEWWIAKMDESGGFPIYTHATIKNNPTKTTYSLAFAGRVSLVYQNYSIAF